MGRPRGRRGLINDSCFGPNTQLADLTKCFVSSLPLFSLAWYNVCPELTGGGEGEMGTDVIRAQGQKRSFFKAVLYIITCDDQLNEMSQC